MDDKQKQDAQDAALQQYTRIRTLQKRISELPQHIERLQRELADLPAMLEKAQAELAKLPVTIDVSMKEE